MVVTAWPGVVSAEHATRDVAVNASSSPDEVGETAYVVGSSRCPMMTSC